VKQELVLRRTRGQQIWVGFVVVTLALLTAQSSFAATKKGSSKRSLQSQSAATVQRQVGNPVELTVGPGLVSGAFTVGLSLNAGATVQVSKEVPILVGLDTFMTLGSRYYYYDFEDGLYGGSSVGVGILGTGLYKFTFPKKQNMHITGGLSMGVFVGGGVAFSMLIRPGYVLDINENMSLVGEPIVGLIGSRLVFMPRAMLSFRL